MKKIIIKTALITFASVIALLALAFGIASLAFPRNMSQICENFGNLRLSASYACRQYDYTGSTDDLYRCADLYIRLGDRGNIVKYCGKLADGDKLDGYCENKEDGTARAQYIYTNYACALYDTKKTDKAAETAQKSVKNGFVVPNAFGSLTVKAVENGDKAFAEKLLQVLPDEPEDEAQKTYYNAVKEQLDKLNVN